MKKNLIFKSLLILLIIPSFFLLSKTTHAASAWQEYPNNPIIVGSNDGAWNSYHVLDPMVLNVNGQYKMWFVGNNGSGWKIGYASSNDGISNWNVSSSEVIPIGTPDGWEKETSGPSVIFDSSSNEYKMWYTSINTDHWGGGSDRFRVRYATSNDGINWNVNPGWVMEGTAGSWDEGGIARGISVIKVNGVYQMWYAATDTSALGSGAYWRIGYATSNDGINWNKENNGNPVIEPTEWWEFTSPSYPDVVYTSGVYEMWYGVGSLDNPTQFAYATSTDGIHWNKPADKNPLLLPSTFDSRAMERPSVIKEGSLDKMWFGGYNQNTNRWTIGFATTEAANQSPTISPFSNATINEGDNFSSSGSFIDSDSSTSWTARVDYGDGLGFQTLNLNPDKSFNLTHRYNDEGSYLVTISITDNQGATGTTTATITVNNAPFVVGIVNTSNSPTQVNTTITAQAFFNDPGVMDTHTASWNWGDGTTTTGTVTESNGSGSVADAHIYTSAGVYTITLTITDDDGISQTSTYQYIVIYDPSAGFITGGGGFTSLPGADTQNPSVIGKVLFGFNAKYTGTNTTPTGSTKMTFKNGNIDLKSSSYDWLVVSGNKAYLHGTGTVNNLGSYNFLITMIDGSPDTLRIKIKDNSNNNIIYDSQMDASDFTDPIETIDFGSIQVN